MAATYNLTVAKNTDMPSQFAVVWGPHEETQKFLAENGRFRFFRRELSVGKAVYDSTVASLALMGEQDSSIYMLISHSGSHINACIFAGVGDEKIDKAIPDY